MKKIIVLLPFLFSITACTDPLGLLDKDSPTRTFTDKEMAQAYFFNSTIECPNNDCEPSSGGLYKYTPKTGSYSVGSCSVTLIGHDKILTNIHCVPDDIQYAGASCQDRINIILPATKGYPKESIPCQSIVSVTKKQKLAGDPDWAILQLARSSSRPPAKVNTDGVALNGQATLYPVYFNLGGDFGHGDLKKVECTSNSTFRYSNDYISPWSSNFNIDSCDHHMISGNSGTGVRNSNNELVGVYAYGDSAESLAARRKKYPGIKDNFGGGTNAACIPDLISTQGNHCSYSNKADYRQISDIAHFTYQQREGGNYKQIREDIEQTYSSTEYTDKMKSTLLTEDQRAQFFYIPINSNTMKKERHYVASLWIANMFPVMPECFHSDVMEAEDSIQILGRTTNNESQTTSPVNYYDSYSSHLTKHTFTIQDMGTHFIIKPKYGIMWPGSYKKMTGAQWTDLEYKVNNCPPAP